MKDSPTSGKITIAPEVLETVVRLTTLAVPGVVRVTPPVGLQRALGLKDVIRVKAQEGVVQAELHIVVESDRNLLGIARQIQDEVSRAVEDMVGLSVADVNVYIEDIVPALGD